MRERERQTERQIDRDRQRDLRIHIKTKSSARRTKIYHLHTNKLSKIYTCFWIWYLKIFYTKDNKVLHKSSEMALNILTRGSRWSDSLTWIRLIMPEAIWLSDQIRLYLAIYARIQKVLPEGVQLWHFCCCCCCCWWWWWEERGSKDP